MNITARANIHFVRFAQRDLPTIPAEELANAIAFCKALAADNDGQGGWWYFAGDNTTPANGNTFIAHNSAAGRWLKAGV